MIRSSLRALGPRLCLVSALGLCGCANLQFNDQWHESNARENERIAGVWRNAGAPSQASRFEQQAERDRQAAKRNRKGLLESVVDSLIIGWLDAPPKPARK